MYYGTFDENKTAAKLWSDAWSRQTSSETASLRLYFDELLRIVEPRLEESDWSVRRQTCSCLAAAINKLENSDLQKHEARVLPKLLAITQGKRWV